MWSMADDHGALEYPDVVRARPGMYVGSLGRRGREQMVREVVSNAVDLALTGQVTTLSVAISSDGTIAVTDDGPGIPVEPRQGGAPFLT